MREQASHLSDVRLGCPARVIPTRVGKASIGSRLSALMSGHPHACGESPSGVCLIKNPIGSSPRVWGKPALAPTPAPSPRVIPTRVGKAASDPSVVSHRTGHPHACGESTGQKLDGGGHDGSSPRVWGKPESACNLPLYCRVIPTRVGKAHTSQARMLRLSGHPHACGESRGRPVRG